VYCAHDRLVAMSSDVFRGQWTPAGGWTVQPGTNIAPAKASNTASTGSRYGIDEQGTLARRDPGGSPKTLLFPPPRADVPPASVWVDDSGGALFACVGQDQNPALEPITCKLAA
jgi:hypothetical protein